MNDASSSAVALAPRSPSLDRPSHVPVATLQLLEWVAERPRTYQEAMDAWRSTCPRHSVWEDALADGLVQLDADGRLPLSQTPVSLTLPGQALLATRAT